MKILLVSNGFPPRASGGVETYTYDLARSLVEVGFQVAVFCRDSDYDQTDYRISDYLEEGIRIIRIVNDHKKIISFQDTYVDEQVESIFRGYLGELAPDLVHINHLIALSVRLPEIVDEAGIPSVITLHDFWPLCQRVNLIDWQGNVCQGPRLDGTNCSVCVVGGDGKVQLAHSMP